MRLFRTAATALGGLLLAVSLPAATAAAANGQFIWEGPKGKIYFVKNPPEGKCFSMGQEAHAARNETQKPLAVYANKGCKGKQLRLSPGEHAPRDRSFASVMFNPH
ncbi:hypothetical protein BLA24_05830 [Streptomyces cinnamoneus]|uniref:Uncharacterized protein n=1 Tax=Streptomyces cinnamoneus TaxID=53446 RepID=A0A2G1XNM2_STRCJ|nr:hypothetical protein [Streptomyces cinnamoneus]PHQ52781.1 hypothetical protein BLA24_05830 [Streptomyces cinnamoneus]PPT11883.1 hypothetical protein CYQ11_02305 [Streptomyces cinnamoneus]